VDGDKLICTPGGEQALLVALDKLTGNGKLYLRDQDLLFSYDVKAVPASQR
jgi:hypothetical protein